MKKSEADRKLAWEFTNRFWVNPEPNEKDGSVSIDMDIRGGKHTVVGSFKLNADGTFHCEIKENGGIVKIDSPREFMEKMMIVHAEPEASAINDIPYIKGTDIEIYEVSEAKEAGIDSKFKDIWTYEQFNFCLDYARKHKISKKLRKHYGYVHVKSLQEKLMKLDLWDGRTKSNYKDEDWNKSYVQIDMGGTETIIRGTKISKNDIKSALGRSNNDYVVEINSVRRPDDYWEAILRQMKRNKEKYKDHIEDKMLVYYLSEVHQANGGGFGINQYQEEDND